MLTLYFDKEFLKDFWIQHDESENPYLKKFLTVLKEFAEMTVFIEGDVQNIELANPYFDYLRNNNKVVFGTKSEFINAKGKSISIAFLSEENEEIEKINSIVVIHFQNLIKQLESIFVNSQFKIDLSEENNIANKFKQLNCLKVLPSKNITLIDKYALLDEYVFKNEFIELLKSIINSGQKLTLTFLTNSMIDRYMTPDEKNVKEGAMFNERRSLINKTFPAKINELKFVKLFSRRYTRFDFHDRILIANLYTIDIGVGFGGTGHNSNSMIIVDTILDKFTYKRTKNITKEIDRYMQWLNNEEQKEIKVY
jgi:hypothetical protein